MFLGNNIEIYRSFFPPVRGGVVIVVVKIFLHGKRLSGVMQS